MVEDLDHPWRIYARQVRWAACGVVCILILALVIGTVWFRVADVHRREAQRRIDISLDMVRQFEGTSLGHPPFGNAPERFVRVLDPSPCGLMILFRLTAYLESRWLLRYSILCIPMRLLPLRASRWRMAGILSAMLLKDGNGTGKN